MFNWQEVSLQEANDEQIISFVCQEFEEVIDYYLGDTPKTIESITSALESQHQYDTLIEYVLESAKQQHDTYVFLFDGNTYVRKYCEDYYTLEKEESLSEYQEKELYLLGNCKVYPTLGRILCTASERVYAGYGEYEYESYTTRTSIEEYKQLVERAIEEANNSLGWITNLP